MAAVQAALLLGALLLSGRADGAPGCPAACECFDGPPAVGRAAAHVSTATCQLSQNASAALVVAQLPADLVLLSFRNSQLTSISVLCCFDELRYLDISFNHIQSLRLQFAFSNVIYLNARNNAIRTLQNGELASFPMVEILNLDDNQIADIADAAFHLYHLRELRLRHNLISSLSEQTFRFAPNLELLDLRDNRIAALRSSNFYFSSRLTELNLAGNELRAIADNALFGLLKLKVLDVSANQLSTVPSRALDGLDRLETIRLAANGFQVLPSGAFANMAALAQIDLMDCPRLRMVLAGAFRHLHSLLGVNMSYCARLAYVAPSALQDVNRLSALDLSRCALESASPLWLDSALVRLTGNPLQCGCTHKLRRSKLANERVMHYTDLSCVDSDGTEQLVQKAESTDCPAALISTSDAALSSVSIGSSVTLVCAERSTGAVNWTLAGAPTPPKAPPSRVWAANESLHIEFVTAADAGDYACAAATARRVFRVAVADAAIVVRPVEIGSYYAVVAWNDSLPVASEHVRLTLVCRRLPTGETRSVFLATTHAWRRRTITRLRAATNYSFCLTYSYGPVEMLYEACTELRTHEGTRLLAGAGTAVLATIAVAVAFLCAVCVARCAHRRFYVWQEAKYRSRMAQSLSGQSFLTGSQSSSLAYENIPMTFRAPTARNARHSMLSDVSL